jgi:choline monooxygenase
MDYSDKLSVNKNIADSKLISPDFYNLDEFYYQSIDKIFSRSWQFVNHKKLIKHQISPFYFMKDIIDEPYVLIKDKNFKILSNVCTHRANVLCLNSSNSKFIKCKYHGRTFHLSGQLNNAPGFENTNNFPSENDNLNLVPIKVWNDFIFCSIKSPMNIDLVFNDISSRLKSYPFDDLVFDESNSSTYIIDAHWALYCENYLEGFHVSFLHKGLNNDINVKSYKTKILDHGVLQYTKGKLEDNSNQVFDNNIYAYYYWIFPNLMLNFYNWGLSINIIEPLAKNKTRVKFLSFPFKGITQPLNNPASIDKVELEDQEIVLNVQKGISSHHYNGGRYSPEHEKGVHYFHQLISRYLD